MMKLDIREKTTLTYLVYANYLAVGTSQVARVETDSHHSHWLADVDHLRETREDNSWLTTARIYCCSRYRASGWLALPFYKFPRKDSRFWRCDPPRHWKQTGHPQSCPRRRRQPGVQWVFSRAHSGECSIFWLCDLASRRWVCYRVEWLTRPDRHGQAVSSDTSQSAGSRSVVKFIASVYQLTAGWLYSKKRKKHKWGWNGGKCSSLISPLY